MKKIFLLLVMVITSAQSNAQFNYKFTDQNVPVVGIQYGVVGGGISAMLMNRDDIESELLDPQLINFNYFAGVERIRWYTPHFGFGQQALLWNAGAAYKGRLSLADDAAILNGKTTLSYAKIPILFWFKSYSRWKPERRLRLNTYFGPYIALLTGAQDQHIVSFNNSDDVFTYTLKSGEYFGVDKDTSQFFNGNADDSSPIKMFDYGFTMGAGLEMRLWTNTVIALTMRTDLGLAEVENKDFKVDLPGNAVRYSFYKDITSKYFPDLNPDNPRGFNRPETNNFSFGAQLSIRKYLGAN